MKTFLNVGTIGTIGTIDIHKLSAIVLLILLSLITSSMGVFHVAPVKTYANGEFASGTFSLTMTGPWANRTIIVKYTRSGGIVSCVFPESYAVATANAIITSSADVLTAPGLKPATDQFCPIFIVSHEGTLYGTLLVRTTGYLEIRVRNENFHIGRHAGIYFPNSCTWSLS